MRIAGLVQNTSAEVMALDAQEAQDEATRQYWAALARFGWTIFYLRCPLDAIEDVARGLRPETAIRFLLARHVVVVGEDRWDLDGDLVLWQKAKAYAGELNHQGLLLEVIQGQGELVYQKKGGEHGLHS